MREQLHRQQVEIDARCAKGVFESLVSHAAQLGRQPLRGDVPVGRAHTAVRRCLQHAHRIDAVRLGTENS
jgi:hypothetical protein